jgi:hypothetical protein
MDIKSRCWQMLQQAGARAPSDYLFVDQSEMLKIKTKTLAWPNE